MAATALAKLLSVNDQDVPRADGSIAVVVRIAVNRAGQDVEIHTPEERHTGKADERQPALGRMLEVGVEP